MIPIPFPPAYVFFDGPRTYAFVPPAETLEQKALQECWDETETLDSFVVVLKANLWVWGSEPTMEVRIDTRLVARVPGPIVAELRSWVIERTGREMPVRCRCQLRQDAGKGIGISLDIGGLPGVPVHP